jgi:hypothetical protein
MGFKKVITSDGQPVIIRESGGEDLKYPPGFSYRIDSMIYTVKKDVTQEAVSSMREVGLSDGSTEIMGVESITKDLKEPGCEVLPVDERFVKREAVQEVTKKKVAKKKAKKKTKKKAKKVAKKND